MKLKEIINLRKLKEEFHDVADSSCRECPFESICGESVKGGERCIVDRIFNPPDSISASVNKMDLYELEMNGLLKDDFQL